MSPIPQDLQTAFINELQSRYDQTGGGWLLSANDIERWAEIAGSTTRHAYDLIARHLAVGFHESRFPFWFCDAVVHAVIGFVYDDFIQKGEDFPALFYKVYLAFDAGEVGRAGMDPIEVHTRPMIEEIVRNLAKEAG
jgi:hypothetical protein